MPNPDEFERSALSAFEELLERPDDIAFRTSLLAKLASPVRQRLLALEARSLDAAEALPTRIPGCEASDVEPPPPVLVGAFRLTRLLGRGGMGEVWLGERADGLFDQRVAIKLIQRRVLTRAAAAFEAERRFLARLEHPEVARLIDGGLTADGLPWLAMEYVEGQPIDAACAHKPLDDRLSVFVAAARAVQFVHSKLVAHGDIKPANIFVDAAGRPKLLDFGIARLVVDGPLSTLAPFTPGFASPERCAGGGPSVADDIYALGRMLMLVLDGDADRELAAIADRATATEAKRYISADALLADILRWQARLPVAAMPDSLRYRARKFCQRHRTGLLLTALALTLLTATAVVAIANYMRAEQQRVLAAARFADAHRVAHYLMFDLIDQLERRPGTLALRARIGHVAQSYLDRLARSPQAPPAVKLDIANGYIRSAMMFGIGNQSNFGDYARAKRDLSQAHATLLELGKDPHMQRAIADPLARLARLECQTQIYGDHDAARALAIARRGLAETSNLSDPNGVAAAQWPLKLCEGDALVWLERTSEAIPLLEAQLSAARARQTLPDPRLVARNLRFLGEAYFYAGRYAAAQRALSEALDMLALLNRREPNDQATINEYSGVADDLASTYSEQKRYGDQLRVARRAMKLAAAQAALDPNDLQSERRALALARLVADALAQLGRPTEAVALMENVDARWDGLVGRFPADGALARLRLMSLLFEGDLLERAGKTVAACSAYHTALSGWARFAQRWKISPSDRREDVDILRPRIAACRTARPSFRTHATTS